MATDTLKNRIRFSTTLDKEIEISLRKYSKETMIPISKIVDCAISEYISRQKEKQTD